MLLKFGINVIDHNEEKIGELKSVIVDPSTDEVSHLVVSKGFLLSKDKLVPISLAASGNEDRIKLHDFEGTIEDLQDYKETHFIPVDNYIDHRVTGEIIPMIFYSPLSVSRSYATQLTSVPVIKKKLPPEKESLKKGMDVVALDGEDVGSVKELILHPTTDRLTHLLVSEGLIFKREFLIPVEWIREVEKSHIHLYVDSKVIGKLPEYEQEGIFSS